jgi:hypothetical protein
MSRPEFKTVLLDQQGPAVILWCFFTISVPIYLLIAQMVDGEGGFLGNSTTTAQTMRAVLWLLVLVDLGYLVWWKRRNLTRSALMQRSNKTKILRALEEHKGRTEERAAMVVSTYVTRKIVVFAIIEAIAVYGLVLALVGRYLWDQYLLSGLSLALLVMEFPRKNMLETLLRETEHES